MIALTEEQFDSLLTYFELALTAMSDEAQARLVFLEKPLRDMLREINRSRALPE